MDHKFRSVILFIIGLIFGYMLALLLSQTQSYVPLIGIFASALIGIGIPVWREYFVTRSKLSLEINSISRKVSESAQISLAEYPELSSLKKRNPLLLRRAALIATRMRELDYISNSKNDLFSVEELDSMVEQVDQEYKDLPQRIDELEKEYERVNSLKSNDLTEAEAKRLNRPLVDEVDCPSESFQEDSKKESILNQFIEKYKERRDKAAERQSELQSGPSSLPVIKSKIEQIKKNLIDNRSYFSISSSLLNSGRLNTSIKPLAVLRVYIGRGNYVDLKLTLRNFEEKSEVSANSTQIVVFESSEMLRLPEEDRQLINTYWGQSVPCILFVEDIHGTILNSDSIAFAEGLYQKLIYDRLVNAAAQLNP